ncbi:MAG TPA: hypothetical protein VIY29_06910 [Ktedonobacteraceae bacterium]
MIAILALIGSIPAALAMLKVRDERALEPPGEKPAPTSTYSR